MESSNMTGSDAKAAIRNQRRNAAIRANLVALAETLTAAAERAAAAGRIAETRIADDEISEIHEAIGTVVGLDQELEAAQALLKGAFALARR